MNVFMKVATKTRLLSAVDAQRSARAAGSSYW